MNVVIAISQDQLEPTLVKGEAFSIQTIFTEGGFLSSGVLVFPAKSEKPSRNSSKHALVFYVIEGTLEVSIHKSSFIATTGTQFIVPRGNQYALKSVWEGESRLFFCHCKDNRDD